MSYRLVPFCPKQNVKRMFTLLLNEDTGRGKHVDPVREGLGWEAALRLVFSGGTLFCSMLLYSEEEEESPEVSVHTLQPSP